MKLIPRKVKMTSQIVETIYDQDSGEFVEGSSFVECREWWEWLGKEFLHKTTELQ